jgi:hypothetical protein
MLLPSHYSPRLRRLADRKGDFGRVGANKRLNLRIRMVEYRRKSAVVKTYPILRSGLLRQNFDIATAAQDHSITPTNVPCSEDLTS